MPDFDQLMDYVWCRQLALTICEVELTPSFVCVPAQAVFARGISAVWQNYICVGRYSVTHLMTSCKQRTSGFTLIQVYKNLVEHLSLYLQGCRMVQSWSLTCQVKAVTSRCPRSWRSIRSRSLTWPQSALAARCGGVCLPGSLLF